MVPGLFWPVGIRRFLTTGTEELVFRPGSADEENLEGYLFPTGRRYK